MKKSVVFGVVGALAALCIPVFPASMASADSATRVGDASGDVPYCQGDIVSAAADWTDARLRFELSTACGMNVDTDAAWVVGATALGFFIDVNRDDDFDYVAVYDSETQGVLYDANFAVVCAGSASHPLSNVYAIELPTGCVPGAFTFFAGMRYDEDPYGETCMCPEDVAPDSVWSGPVDQPRLHGQGYWMLGRDGAVYAFGDAAVYDGERFPAPAVDLEPTPTGRGYWLVNEDGEVAAYGDATPFGSAWGLQPGETATAISRTPSGDGYWIFTSVGRVLAFGDAVFFGHMAHIKLNGPVLDAIPTPSGRGYYMVASDGGIFTFGDAVFQGSMGSVRLNAPVQSLVPDPDGAGYWLVASDGGIFSFAASFYGSMGSVKLNKPVTGMVGFGHGYLMVAEDGGIFSFGDAPFLGSLGANPPSVPIVSTAVLNQ